MKLIMKHRYNKTLYIINNFIGKPAKLNDRQNPDCVPSQNMGYGSISLSSSSSLKRFNRAADRQVHRLNFC